MVVGLYLVDEDQGVFLTLHLITCHDTQGEIEIVHGLSIGKILFAHLIRLHIEFDKVRKTASYQPRV